jgi:AraC family transcriptional regulator
MSANLFPIVSFTPENVIRRQSASWRGFTAEIIQAVENKPFEYGFLSSSHLLIATERAERFDGETSIGTVLRSNRREFNRKLTFVPAGCRYYGWTNPRVLTRTTYFYIDPAAPLFAPDSRLSEVTLEPRLFFEDAALWETTRKLKVLIEGMDADEGYAQALGAVLAHELVRLNAGRSAKTPATRGGLASWQKRLVEEYINAHLTETIPLEDLARVARLSPFHFARAFKQSFGLPPHRYHMHRRIEQAKALLATPQATVTEVGVRLGFSDTSTFSVAFRRLTGSTPGAYRRSVA